MHGWISENKSSRSARTAGWATGYAARAMGSRKKHTITGCENCAQRFGQELREDSLFLFCGRRTDRIKALYYSGDGYVLLYKRLNNGAFQWPRTAAELRKLDTHSFRWLMEGLQIDQPKAIQKGKAKYLF